MPLELLSRASPIRSQRRAKPADIPSDVAKALYPLPYLTQVQHAAEKNKVDPMLVAGIMRQESAFASEAVSHAGADGLNAGAPENRAWSRSPAEAALFARASFRSGVQSHARNSLRERFAQTIWQPRSRARRVQFR